ncbi:unnamed protein product [Rotaria sordida]|uniref:Uncharacterized protein n=1 Tax=Rotaria sordida TaxID=392033 RepID=A0A820D8F9_9BILA|nr:unnamed protein product [Rotaria sordida]
MTAAVEEAIVEGGASSTTLIIPPPIASSISHPSTYTSAPLHASVPPDPVNFSSHDAATIFNSLTDGKKRITKTIID